MKLLLFSDLHRNKDAARSLVERSSAHDVVVGAGDFATMRRGIEDVLVVLRAIEKPTVVVPGNGESDDELRRACAGWANVHVLHGSGVTVDGVPFFGLGAAVPETPFGAWSFDLSEARAAELLVGCPDGGVLVSHSPPKGLADVSSDGRSLGSTAVLATIERCRPRLVVCGHIHDSWGREARHGETVVVNAGPKGVAWELA